MKHYLGFALILIFTACQQEEFLNQPIEIEINDNWKFSQENSEAWYPALVPGVVHLDLLANQLIEDPYWENNELKQRWIEEENWVYKTIFKADKKLLQNQQIELHFRRVGYLCRCLFE